MPYLMSYGMMIWLWQALQGTWQQLGPPIWPNPALPFSLASFLRDWAQLESTNMATVLTTREWAH